MKASRLLYLKTGAFARVAESTPWPVLRSWVAQQTKGMHVALCLHRVEESPDCPDPLPSLSIRARELDLLLAEMCAARAGDGGRPWLTVAFDDGYASAAHYVATRAPQYPNVEWMLFVCPHKIRERQGFRWDAYPEAFEGDDETWQDMPADYEHEIGRTDLRAASERFALATEADLARLTRLDNVKLGNHTNSHLLAALPLNQAIIDLRASTELFEEMFGPCQEFAFPFGVPDRHFRRAHVDYLRELRPLTMWTTEQLPFHPDHRHQGAVLPRIVVDGRWSAKTMMMWVGLRARKMQQGRAAPWSTAAAHVATLAGMDWRALEWLSLGMI